MITLREVDELLGLYYERIMTDMASEEWSGKDLLRQDQLDQQVITDPELFLDEGI